MDTSISNAPAPPTMSAPTPLAGSSTRWTSAAASSPTTTSAACRAALPGHDPVPLAVAKTLIGQPYSTALGSGRPGLLLAPTARLPSNEEQGPRRPGKTMSRMAVAARTPVLGGASPVDIDTLAKTAPPQCRFVYADTATFGPDVETFHKTTFQYPPRGGLISEGAAAYRDADTASRAFGALATTVRNCADSSAGLGL